MSPKARLSALLAAAFIGLAAAILVAVYGPTACAAMYIAVFLGVLFLLDALGRGRRP